MRALTFSSGAKLSWAYIFRILFFPPPSFIVLHKRLTMNDDDDRTIMPTWHKWLRPSASAIFDNSFIHNCLCVHQTNGCSRVRNLGHLFMKPTVWILSRAHKHSSLCHFHIEIWFWRQMHIPGGPIDMTRKITHCWGDIFRPLLLCRAKQRDLWVIAHLNNAKCVLLQTQEAPDAKWIGWQGTADEMPSHKSLSMFPFSTLCLSGLSWSALSTDIDRLRRHSY